jgi:hypothetical protein
MAVSIKYKDTSRKTSKQTPSSAEVEWHLPSVDHERDGFGKWIRDDGIQR